MKKSIIFYFLAAGICSGCNKPSAYSEYNAEVRACWVDQAATINWDSAMAELSKAGFNVIFPNVLSSGSAYYPSKYIPMTGKEDKLARCLEAAHAYGIEVHVWKVNWALWRVNEDSLAKYVREDRIQISYDQKRVPQVSSELGWNQKYDWLCPSHPVNRELEKNLMMELVRNYDVDGVHFDYMRYPYEPLCYCRTCRRLFVEEKGLQIDDWPADVWKGGKYREVYLDWRRAIITSSAREIAEAIHEYDPYVCVSLAARSELGHAYISDAQEWWKWDEEGILDFVCPMNYSDRPSGYLQDIRDHFPLVRGQIPYYGGIGLFRMRNSKLLEEAIEGGRQLGQDGFVIFSYEWGGLRSMLDTVAAFLKNKEYTVLPHRAPEVGFYFQKTDQQTEEGFPVFGIDKPVNSEVSVMMKARLKQGVSGINGKFLIRNVNGGVVQELIPVDIDKSDKFNLTFNLHTSGRYRLTLAGYMKLSDGRHKPFVSASFPFEIQ